MEQQDKTMCCPPFDPTLWADKEIVWQNKLFIKDKVAAFFHFPLNMGAVITRMWKKVTDANAQTEMNDWILLSDEVSPWTSIQLMAVTKEVPGAENVSLSGTFLTKVFEGPYKNAPQWYAQMNEYVKEKGYETKKFYFYYTTCPTCAKKYGKNYVVTIAQIK